MSSRLLSIELQGYKTFANRFRFDFPEDITCVVGPNGSGKSNVADAIRWVLGEQSFNLLRARKTEDMIFSGSTHRPQAGMATVSIVFDNEDHWFPLDFSEVSITRRAYRDGQNEYLLNNQKVRLKDISELLAQSGVTPRTYTIIGQGLVDAALSLRPDERRQFFEEAAGISLHRKRREEAISRLDTTHRNLDRVLDILNELKPRLTSLEKQATRAIEQERIKSDLSVLIKEWYGFHWHKAQDELQRSREILHSQEVRLEQNRKQKEQLDHVIDERREKLFEIRKDLSSWHAEASGLHNELEATNKSIAVAEERLRSLGEQNDFIVTDLAKVTEEILAVKARLDDDYKEKKTILTEKSELATLLTQADQKYQELLRDKNEAEKNVVEAEQVYKELESEKIRINVRLQEISSQQETLSISKAKLIGSEADNQENLKALKDEQRSLEKSFNTLQSILSKEKFERDQIQGERKKLTEQLDGLKSNQNELESKISKKTAQKEIFKASLRANEHMSSTAQAFIKAISSKQKDIPLQAVLGSFVVDKGYEKAITAGLGEYLDGFILQKETDLKKLLNDIQNENLGRVVLFSEDHSEDLKTRHLGREYLSEILGTGLDFIQFVSEESSPVIESLLGDILLVDDRVSALNLMHKVPKHCCIVTRSGEVYRGNSAIISGKEERDTYFMIQRRMEELQEEITSLEKGRTKVIAQIVEIKDKIADRDRALVQQEENVNQIQEELTEISKSSNKVNLHINQVEEHLKFLNDQVAHAAEQEQASNEKIAEAEKRLLQIESELKAAYHALLTKVRVKNEIDTEEIRAERNYWQTKLAVFEKSILEIERRISLESKRLAELEQQKLELEERSKSIVTENEQISERQGDHYEKISSLKSKLEALSEKIKPSENTVLQLESSIRKANQEQNLLQQRLAMAERYVTQAQLDLSRRNDELEKLREKIEDDFGLVQFEYKNDIVGPTPLPLNGMVNELPLIEKISPDIEETIRRQKAQLRRMGPINPDARTEYVSVKERYDHLSSQVVDLEKADHDLREIIRELDDLMKREFQTTFSLVAQEFKEMFARLFGGGSAKLLLLDEENPTEAGIEIEAQLPGKRKQGLAVLSGGERSLTAVALIFALLKVSPTPFCVLDEVDAALDEANVGRFGLLLRELSEKTQFIVITHNRNTVQLADVIYGVTLSRDSTSQVISLKMDEVSEHLVS